MSCLIWILGKIFVFTSAMNLTLKLCQSYDFAACLLPILPETSVYPNHGPRIRIQSDLLCFATCSVPIFTDIFALSARRGIHSHLFNLGLVFPLSVCTKRRPVFAPLSCKFPHRPIIPLSTPRQNSQTLLKLCLAKGCYSLFSELVKHDCVS